MNKTSISWTGTYQADGTLKPGYTSNPIRARSLETGKVGHFCEKVSPGCAHCYASEWNENRYGTGIPFLPANREKVEVYLEERELAEWSKPKYAGAKVFVCDMTDLFGEWVPDHWIIDVLAGIERSPATFQILTKRPARMCDIMTRFYNANRRRVDGSIRVMENLWLGVSAENQHWLEERVHWLLDTSAAIRFLSYEPALGPLDLKPKPDSTTCIVCGEGPLALHSHKWGYRTRGLDWVIFGAESGPRRRPFNLAWARLVRDQCRGAGVTFWMKQGSGAHSENYDTLPDDLKIREFPA